MTKRHDDGLTAKGRWIAGLLAASLLFGGAALVGGYAAGAPGTVLTDAIQGSWSDDTAHLAWNGTQYTTIEVSFVGDRVAIPGDSVERTLNVTNNGPSAASVTVSLLVSEILPQSNSSLDDNVSLFWDVNAFTGQAVFSQLLAKPGGQMVVATFQVAQGATFPVTVGYTVSDGLSPGGGSVLEFDVEIDMQGDTEEPPPPAPAPSPTPTPTPTPAPTPTPPAAATGGSVVQNWLPLAFGLLSGGALVIALLLMRSPHRSGPMLNQR